MAIDEKYLDDLLKSITENEEEPRTMSDAMREMASSSEAGAETEEEGKTEAEAENDSWVNDLDNFFSQPQDLEYGDSVALDDYTKDALTETAPDAEEDVDLEEMQLLKEITEAGFDYEQVSLDDSQSEEDGETDDEVDISEMMDNLGTGNDDLDEINGLLNNVDEGAAVDEDILALLEGMDGSEESGEAEDAFNLFEEDGTQIEEGQSRTQAPQPEDRADDVPEPEEKKEKKARKKKVRKEKSGKDEKKFRIMRKKRNDTENTDSAGDSSDVDAGSYEDGESGLNPAEKAPEEVEPGIAAYEEAEEIEDIREKDEIEENKGKKEKRKKKAKKEDKETKEKKPGALAGFFAALFQEEEDLDTAAEDNKKLIKEIGEEDKKGKKSKKKKGKADDSAKADKKEKKPKKEKAPKKPKEKKPKEKKPEENVKERTKPLGKKTWFVVIALCGTLLASIMLLSVFLPEYSDKRAAKNAFYSGDYETVYTLLYGKKLSDDDLLMFNKAKTIRIMERRLESYGNKLALGQEVEAVDTLLKAVSCYQRLTEADEFGVRNEVDAVYQQICALLENDYGITEEDAMEINSYDSQDYTRRLHTAVYGTDFAVSDEDGAADEASQSSEDKQGETSPAQDILPEEEDFIDN